MKLTNHLRDVFVRRVMVDLPATPDYKDQAGKILTDDCIAQLPEDVRAIWFRTDLRQYLDYRDRPYYRRDALGSTTTYYIAFGCSDGPGSEPCKEACKRADALLAKAVAADKSRDELKTKLRGVAYGCTTVAALRLALPEFEKYMPEKPAKPERSLPVVTGVYAAFRAAGWPKDGATAS
ncbi:MAG: hypothetical protein E6Q97_16370 [Desulfurellales bacterium]|nr:MAG: hypothetical protein E6Q97_16370 [Desulfurellales bacterium]